MSIGPGGRRKFFETNDHEDRMSEPSAVPSRPQRSLRKLPKAHLHVHLDGSYPLYAVEALARRRRMAFRVPGRFPSVQSFFDAYLTVPNLVESHEDLAGLCRALVHADAADGVVYMEPAIEPQLYAPRIGTLDQVTKTMMRAFAEASMDAGIEVGALLTINTDGDLEIAEDLAGIAAAYAGRRITGLGTAGFVEPGNLRRYRSSAKIAQAVGLPVVSHAGQTGGADSIREALDELGATRISHGFRAIECTDMVKRLADEQIVCDMCPVSNVRLGVVSGMCNHPAPSMLAAGVQITLNADDSLWFSAGVTDQYTVARDEWGLADAQIARFARAGALATGMSDSSRARLLDGIDAWMNGDTL
jgi:adenosine deaminase